MSKKEQIRKKIVELSEKHLCNAATISRGCEVSLPTIYKILKGDYKSVRRQSLEKVLFYLMDLDKKNLKMYKEDPVKDSHVPSSEEQGAEYEYICEIFKMINEQANEIKRINENISKILNLLQGGFAPIKYDQNKYNQN